MNKAEKAFTETGSSLKGAEQSQMFGKPCFKIAGKAFACFFNDCMVFKLTGKSHEEALARKGSVLFDPSGKGRAMKEWVQVPFDHQGDWKKYAQSAFEFVKSSVI